MSVSADYLAFVTDQLARSMKVTSRRMFGGIGLYADDLFFGLIDDDVLFLKVDDSNREDYTSRGCAPFQPLARDQTMVSIGYFAVPPEVLEDPDDLARWARKSWQVAAAAAASKRRVPVAKTLGKKRTKKAAVQRRRTR